jgi:hypothetical protein
MNILRIQTGDTCHRTTYDHNVSVPGIIEKTARTRLQQPVYRPEIDLPRAGSRINGKTFEVLT